MKVICAVAVAVLALTACGGGTEQASDNTTTTTATSTTTSTSTSTSTTAPAMTIDDALTIVQRDYPELENLDAEAAQRFVSIACLRRGEGVPMDQVYDELGAALEQTAFGESRGAIEGIGLLLGAGMQITCPDLAP